MSHIDHLVSSLLVTHGVKHTKIKIFESSPNQTFLGISKHINTIDTDPGWRIIRVSTSGGTHIIEHASLDFDKIWSLRSTYFGAIPFDNTYSFYFNGNTNAYAIAAHNAAIDFSNIAAFSIGFWLRVTRTNAYTLLQKAAAAAGTNGYTVEIDGAQRPSFEFRATGTADRELIRCDSPVDSLNQPLNLANGFWHHLLWTRGSGSGASKFKLYIDKVLQTLTILNNTLVGSTNNTSGLYVAANSSGASRYEDFMDELSIWNAELSQSDVNQVYNSNLGVIDLKNAGGLIQSSLVAWWRMGDGSTYPNIVNEISGSPTLVLQSGTTPGDITTEVPP